MKNYTCFYKATVILMVSFFCYYSLADKNKKSTAKLLPEKIIKELLFIDTDNPDWEVYISFWEQDTENPEIFKCIPLAHLKVTSEEYIKKRSENESMRGLSCIYAKESRKLPVAKKDYKPLIDVLVTQKAEQQEGVAMESRVYGIFLVFDYKKLPRFIIDVCSSKQKTLPFSNATCLHILKQDIIIGKIVGVEQYTFKRNNVTDKLATDFWEKFEVGVWTPEKSLEEFEKKGDSYKFVPRRLVKKTYNIHTFLQSIRQCAVNDAIRLINEKTLFLKEINEKLKKEKNPEKIKELNKQKEENLEYLKCGKKQLIKYKKQAKENSK